MSTINLTTKKVGEITGDFIIPSYQRGYRWQEEVKILLDDINEVPEGANYCLQPIVVKKIDDNKYELIDGQQRLTTLFLILGYIRTFRPKLQQKYTIDYEIREKSKEFLSNIDFDNINDDAENIDEYFIKEAAKTIKNWFDSSTDADNTASLIANKLNNKVNVIWYEINGTEDAISLFTRLNIGKIPLTNAELVKAIFLSRNNGIDERYQLEISTQWDDIEKELHDEKLWYFITNKRAEDFSTRIELLFDLMANKTDGDKERYRTFFWFMERSKSNDYKENKIELWKKVVETFQRIKEWYNDSELYHKIGYLISVDQCSLQTMIEESSQKGKSDFKSTLNEYIANSINFNKEYHDLSHDNKSDYPSIEKLLLLFNVESVFQNGDKSMRFPFDKHKNKNGGWSLEHIHAQQSEGLNTKALWNEWLDLHVQSLRNIDLTKNATLIEEIESRDKENTTEEQFNTWFEKVIQALNLEQNIDYIHMLSNMALLGTFDNSALNNSTFDVKRDKIIEMDKNGDYIPICTRRVFLKYYTPSDKNQLHFWGKADRDAYVDAMNATLKPYLSIIDKQI
ncbi:MAG: DUF262 domain-containing protein [Bacteroidales bacterium]|nr:DUF262 domain-containing protein [Candidatus Colimorpha pelethequi]